MNKYLTLILLLLCLQGCSVPYLFHVSTGHLRLIEKREDIEQVIQDDALSPSDIEKLKLVLEIREFSINRLGLNANGHYTQFVKLNREAVAYNLVVCPKDALTPYSWWFPFAGRLGYLGFFNKRYAMEVQDEYKEKGYDTYVRGVSAYSTLGWFNDPVLSSMLTYSEEGLANLIIHELAHGTVYKKGDTEFNEGVATFIGNVGSIQFLVQKYGKNSLPSLRAVDRERDDLLFSRFMEEARKSLEAFYRQPLPIEEKIKRRETEFKRIKEKFLHLKPQFKTSSYAYFEKLPFNNAVLAGFGQYYKDLKIFERVWIQCHHDFKKALDIFIKAQNEDDPTGYLSRLSF